MRWFVEAKQRYDNLPQGSATRIAKKLGVGLTSLSKMWSGVRAISGHEALVLSRELGMGPPEDVLGKTGAKALGAIWAMEDAGIPDAAIDRVVDEFAEGAYQMSSGIRRIGRAAEASRPYGKK